MLVPQSLSWNIEDNSIVYILHECLNFSIRFGTKHVLTKQAVLKESANFFPCISICHRTHTSPVLFLGAGALIYKHEAHENAGEQSP